MMIKKKVAALLSAALFITSMALAADPAVVQDGQKAVYTRDNGSTLTIQYPQVTVVGNDAASQKIAQYFIEEEQKAKQFFDKESLVGMKMTEEKSYVVTLNDGEYLSIIDQGYLYFDRAAHPTSWKNGVTFDLKTGERLDWQDLVRPEDAKAFTLKKINDKIFLSKYVLSRYFDGLTELPKNYYLDKNKTIHFLFGQYEIAPYSTGIVDIDMGKKAK